MTIIAHLSDTHFGTELPPVVEAIKQTLNDMQPDILIISGDVTQRARIDQFRAAREFMNQIPARTRIVIPGNHDIPLYNVFARAFTPYQNYSQILGARETQWYDGNIGVVAYDTTNPARHTKGRLKHEAAVERLKWMRETLGPEGVIVACVHQPLLTEWPEDAHEILLDAPRTASLLAQYRTDIVLSGHVHVPMATTTLGAYPDLPFHFVLAGAGTAVSWRSRPGAPNSFNKITISEAEPCTITIEEYVYDSTWKKFASRLPQYFIRSDTGWQMTDNKETTK